MTGLPNISIVYRPVLYVVQCCRAGPFLTGSSIFFTGFSSDTGSCSSSYIKEGFKPIKKF